MPDSPVVTPSADGAAAAQPVAPSDGAPTAAAPPVAARPRKGGRPARNGVLAMTPFWLYAEYRDLWNPRFDPMGGMHILGRSLIMEMAGRGFPHRVLTMAPPGIPRDMWVTDNVSVHARRLPILPIPSKLEGYFGLVGAWAKASLLHVVRRREELRREIGVVHAHCDGSGSAPSYAAAAARVLDVPLVAHIYSCRSLTQHPTTWFERVSDPVAKPAEAYVIRHADAVLTLGELTREQIRDTLGIPEARVHRLAHLTDDGFVANDTAARREELQARLNLRPGEPVVLYVGRIASEKGVEYVVRAAAELVTRQPCRFVIAGDGPQRAEIEALIDELGIRSHVVITGFLPPEQVASMITLSTLAVLPSRYEELGVVVLEYMMMRRPVVAHDVSGVRKLISDEQTGLLVTPFDALEMADAIERLLGDAELRIRLAEAAAEIPEREYSLAAAGSRLEEIYQVLMEESS